MKALFVLGGLLAVEGGGLSLSSVGSFLQLVAAGTLTLVMQGVGVALNVASGLGVGLGGLCCLEWLARLNGEGVFSFLTTF